MREKVRMRTRTHAYGMRHARARPFSHRPRISAHQLTHAFAHRPQAIVRFSGSTSTASRRRRRWWR